MALPPKPWPTGKVETLAPKVRRVLAPNGSPFTFTGTQTYLIGDEEGLVVLDPGPDEADHLAALRLAIGNSKVIALSCTHTHRDHSPAASVLADDYGAPIVGCSALALDDHGPRVEAPFDKAYRPDRVLADGEAIEGPSFILTAVATPGHTSNHLCFALEGSGILFTGDHVMGWSTSVVAPPDGNMGDYMDSLQKLYDRDDKVYYPAHGPAIEKTRQFIRGMIGHRRQRERQILRLLEEGVTRVEDMVPRMYKGVHERLWPAAGQSVLAHLLHLEGRDLVTRIEDGWALKG